MKRTGLIVAALAILLGDAAQCRADVLTYDQQVFAGMLSTGSYYYPVIGEGPMAGQLAIFDDIGVAITQSPGWFRSLLKGVGVFSAGVAGGAGGFLVGGPVGAGVGGGAAVGGYKTFVDSLNATGPPPGKKWLVSDARIYNSINVQGIGDVLPAVQSLALGHITTTVSVFSDVTISFVDPLIFPLRVIDQNLDPINTIVGAGVFVAQSSYGTAFGSYMLNEIGSPGSRPMTPTDYLEIEFGSLLSVPNGTPIEFQSTLFVGVAPVPEPTSLAMLGIGAFAVLLARSRKRQKKTI